MESPRAKILLQLDTDPQPSVFDAVVAIDAGVDQLLRHGGVTVANVRDLVYGAMFTRSPGDLKSTAIFVGGSNGAAAEQLLSEIRGAFFGPLRLSVLLDPNGSNTTAAAAVLAASRHLNLAETTALVLGATGPVGSRVLRLLARQGTKVRGASRDLYRARELCQRVAKLAPKAALEPVSIATEADLTASLAGAQLVIAAGAIGVALLPKSVRRQSQDLRVAVDLNAVAPLGIPGIEPTDKETLRDGTIAYGAIGIGGLKMKIHRRAIQRLFESNDQILDAEEVFQIGKELDGS